MNGGRDVVGMTDRRQLSRDDAGRELVDETARDGQRQPRLADPTRPGRCHQPRARQPAADGFDRVLAANTLRDRRGLPAGS
jgi:hypothetical protein